MAGLMKASIKMKLQIKEPLFYSVDMRHLKHDSQKLKENQIMFANPNGKFVTRDEFYRVASELKEYYEARAHPDEPQVSDDEYMGRLKQCFGDDDLNF